MIECKICFKQVDNLYRLAKHLARSVNTHKLNIHEYYDKFLLKDQSEKKCHYRNCNNDVSFSGLEYGYRRYCSSSCCNKEKIFSQEFIEHNRQAQIVAQNRPEVKQKSRETAIAQWKDADVRYRTIKTFKETVAIPEVKRKMSESAISRFKDSEYRRRYLESMKRLWLDENYRKQFKNSHNTQKAKLNHSLAAKSQWKTDKFRIFMTLFLNNSKHKKHMSDLITKKMLNNSWNPYHGKYKHGYYYSEKNNKFLFYRSSIELSVYKLLDKDDRVKIFECEPFRIPYIDKDGNSKFYIPDLLVIYKNGVHELVEIKPDVFISDENIQCKIKAANEYCIKNNMIFRVWLESEIKIT